MGLFEGNADTDTLRAVAFARLQIEGGLGLESVVVAMSKANLGTVNALLAAPVDRMRAGEDPGEVLREAAANARSRAHAELIASLLTEGQAAIQRMDELCEAIQSERKVKVENYAKGLSGKLNFVAILVLAAYVPLLVRVIDDIPPNAILPDITVPDAFYAGWSTFLAVGLTVIAMTMRYDG